MKPSGCQKVGNSDRNYIHGSLISVDVERKERGKTCCEKNEAGEWPVFWSLESGGKMVAFHSAKNILSASS